MKYKEIIGREHDRIATRQKAVEKLETTITTKRFCMTKAEFDTLSLGEMQALYEQYPKEVEALIRSTEP